MNKIQQKQRFLKLFNSIKEGEIKIDFIKTAADNPHNKKIKPIELRLILASRTEEKLREYVRKEFNLSLEEKLMNVLKNWIGKAITPKR